MNRTLAIFCTAVALVVGGWAAEAVRYGTESTLADAPPEAPRFDAAGHPAYEVISGICVVRDADGAGSAVFGSGGFWYVQRQGYWFRSRSFAGPYEAAEPDGVPPNIRRLTAPDSRYTRRS